MLDWIAAKIAQGVIFLRVEWGRDAEGTFCVIAYRAPANSPRASEHRFAGVGVSDIQVARRTIHTYDSDWKSRNTVLLGRFPVQAAL